MLLQIVDQQVPLVRERELTSNYAQHSRVLVRPANDIETARTTASRREEHALARGHSQPTYLQVPNRTQVQPTHSLRIALTYRPCLLDAMQQNELPPLLRYSHMSQLLQLQSSYRLKLIELLVIVVPYLELILMNSNQLAA